MPPTRTSQQPKTPSGSPLISMSYNNRKIRALRPPSYKDIEATARRIFNLRSTQELTLSFVIPTIDDEEMEIDRALWHEVKDQITVVSVVASPEDSSIIPKTEDQPTQSLLVPSRKISFRVVLPDGNAIPIMAKSTASWAKVHGAIAVVTGCIFTDDFYICYDGNRMDPSQTLEDTMVDEIDTSYVIVKNGAK